ncbi:VOC family protein [Streptomyces sporangiiformans]|uniref:VOC family protein n=1 Tax=Streptomyces sporangiiformans TaxID=2315329 RepID=A0A505DF76_9ACTN|nr:VOC family protein [Streptomyces sporangiiformans]TPQ16529.1 VOC family protein [Streptomyces sporangiiformans]
MTARPGLLNKFCWMDLKTRDLPGTAAFFSKVLGWHFAVDEEDWRQATKITVEGHRIGSVSDLANPVYPPATPAHIAYYLAVGDIDGSTEAATANGARLVVLPFDAGDQGRIATLIDPVGAAFSLWQPHRFTGWEFPPDAAGAPHRMVLTCDQPELAQHFYRETTGTSLVQADFLATHEYVTAAPQWEPVVGVDDLDSVVARARDFGQGLVTRSEETGRPVVRLSSPEGLTFQVRLNQ